MDNSTASVILTRRLRSPAGFWPENQKMKVLHNPGKVQQGSQVFRPLRPAFHSTPPPPIPSIRRFRINSASWRNGSTEQQNSWLQKIQKSSFWEVASSTWLARTAKFNTRGIAMSWRWRSSYPNKKTYLEKRGSSGRRSIWKKPWRFPNSRILYLHRRNPRKRCPLQLTLIAQEIIAYITYLNWCERSGKRTAWRDSTWEEQ